MNAMMPRRLRASGVACLAAATLAVAALSQDEGFAQQGGGGTFRLLTFESGASGPRMGTTQGNGEQDIVDVHNAVVYLLKSGLPAAKTLQPIPVDMRSLLEAGSPSLAAVKALHQTIVSVKASGKFTEPGGRFRVFHSPASVRYMPPVIDPVHVFGLAGNYIRRTPGGEPGDYDLVEYPSAFLKPLSSLVGHDHEINMKGLLTTITHEPEFSIVIGRRATNVAQADAMDYVAGYTILNDVSSRDLQAGRHTSQGATMRKGLDSFAPVGPYITLKEDVPNPHNLAIAGSINGKPSQVFNPNTSFMTFTVEELIAFYSERVTLLPGDIIATGVPVAVMDSEAGDLVELTIGNLGTLRNRVVAKPVPGHRNFPPRAVSAVPTR